MHGQNANTSFLVARAGVSSFRMCLLLWWSSGPNLFIARNSFGDSKQRIGGLNTNTRPNLPDADASARGNGDRGLGAHRGTPQKDLRGTMARRRGAGQKAA